MSSLCPSFSLLSNAALVVRCQYEDEDAFAELFRRHRHMIYRVCLRYLGHHHDAEDVTQETFRRAALAMPRVDARRPLEPWLVTIAANRCRTFLARQQKDQLARHLDEEACPAITADNVPLRLALDEQIEHALNRLPLHQRQAFELVHRSELSYPEAASLLGRSTGTVKTWVHRAKLAMRDTLVSSGIPAVSAPAPHASSTDALSDVAAAAQPAGSTPWRTPWIASATIALALWAFGHSMHRGQQFSLHSRDTPASATENATSGSPQRQAAAAPAPVAEPAVSSHAEIASADWQWNSLRSFSQIQFSVDSIQTLPIGDWILQTTPTLEHLRGGIEPLGATLQRAALLFQCDLAVFEHASPTSRGEDRIDTIS